MLLVFPNLYPSSSTKMAKRKGGGTKGAGKNYDTMGGIIAPSLKQFPFQPVSISEIPP